MHLTKELAVRFADHHIRVNCIAYGGVEGRVDTEFKARYASHLPLGRMLKEEDLIGPLRSLIQDDMCAITGHVVNADGGWTLW